MEPKLKELRKYTEYDLVPVYEEILSDSATPLNVLRNIKEISEQFYLLESVDPSKFSRYSYLGYNPIHKISCKDNKVIFDGHEYYSDNPIDEISKKLNEYKAPRLNGLPPFCGGFVGYFAYDSYKYLEPKLQFKSKDVAKFNDYELLMFDKVICFDAFKQKIIIICNIHTNNLEEEYELAKKNIREIKKLVLKIPKIKNEKIKIIKKPESIDDKEEYIKKILKVKKHIYDGDIFQCVFSRRLKGKIEGSLFEAYRNLRSINPSPYMYYLKSNDIEIAGYRFYMVHNIKIQAVYDITTGILATTYTIRSPYVINTDKIYKEPEVPFIIQGTDNIFGTISLHDSRPVKYNTNRVSEMMSSETHENENIAETSE